MGFPGETREARNLRLFQEDLKLLLQDTTEELPSVDAFRALERRWNVGKDKGTEILHELGWGIARRKHMILERLPEEWRHVPVSQSGSESSIPVTLKPRTVIRVSEVPHVSLKGKVFPARDSDGDQYGSDKDR